MTAPVLFDALSELVTYPAPGCWERWAACRDLLAAEQHPAAAALVAGFVEQADRHDLAELEEQFTRTFDINPVVSLEVGWHLFGEQYERGAFLVYLRGQLREHDLVESAELPDHLTHVLPLLGRTAEEQAGVLAREALRPALDKMLEGLAGQQSPYEPVLQAIRAVVARLHPGGPAALPVARSRKHA